jgi:hypothetical protein
VLLDRIAASIVTNTTNPEEVCLQCEVYLKERCLLQEVARRTCSYRRRSPGGREACPRAGEKR